jgi:hypothetical protein
VTPTRDDRSRDDSAATPFFEQLEVELVRAGERQVRKRAQRRSLAAAAVAVAIASIGVGIVTSLRSDPVQAEDVRIDVEGERVTVTFDRDELSGKTVVEQMRRAGLDVDAVPTPTGSSRVGKVVGVNGDTETLEIADLDGEVRYSGPRGVKIEVLIGEAVDDEGYTAFTDAFLPGEPLACVGWVGQRAVELTRAADAKGVDVAFRHEEDQRILDRSALADLVVTQAIAVSPDEVKVFVDRVDATPNPRTGCG